MRLQNFNNSFQSLRNITYMAVLSSFVVCVGMAIYVIHYTQESHQKIYVVGYKKTFPAQLSVQGKPSVYEANNLIQEFMDRVFAHDEYTFHKNLERALHFIDRPEGLTIYEDFNKHQVYDNYVKFGSRSYFELDSLNIEMAYQPHVGQVFGRQIIVYDNQQKVLPIGASFILQSHRRNDHNPYGLLIKEWKFIRYGGEYFQGEKGGVE